MSLNTRPCSLESLLIFLSWADRIIKAPSPARRIDDLNINLTMGLDPSIIGYVIETASMFGAKQVNHLTQSNQIMSILTCRFGQRLCTRCIFHLVLFSCRLGNLYGCFIAIQEMNRSTGESSDHCLQ
jgi:hypothetical protein